MQTQNLPTHPMIFLSCPIEFVPTEDGEKMTARMFPFISLETLWERVMPPNLPLILRLTKVVT